MRHVSLTCKNHPELRWSCKEAAFTDGYGYNGSRNIFFAGASRGRLHSDKSGVACDYVIDGKIYHECACPPSDLIRSPEDAEIQAHYEAKYGKAKG